MIRFLLLSVYLVQEVLDELLLVLGRGLDGRSSLLLLTTTASGEVDTTEQGAHDAHGEDVGTDLLAGNLVVDNHGDRMG